MAYKHFHIMNGLRGAYMPDSHHVIRCATRRDLKSALEYEAETLRDAGAIGLSKRAIASLAARAWRVASHYDHVAPYRYPGACDPTARPYALMVSSATREEHRESENAL